MLEVNIVFPVETKVLEVKCPLCGLQSKSFEVKSVLSQTIAN